MSLEVVNTRERPDLVEVSARWRWGEFFDAAETPFATVLAGAQATAAGLDTMPQTLVLLEDGVPVGTASLAEHDLDERPALSPWLAGVFVHPAARRRGHAARLVGAVERLAADAGIGTLWLYTRTAERIYARAGWTTVERLQRGGKDYAVMRRELRAAP